MVRESVRWPLGVVAGFPRFPTILALYAILSSVRHARPRNGILNTPHSERPRCRSERGGNRPRSDTGHRMMPAAKEGR
jgi:hypothetical protein